VNRMVPVNALGGGRVVELKASLGDHVLKGQPLVTISSPDLSGALSDHLKAVADAALAKRQLDRSRALFEHGSVARKDLEGAEDVDQKAQIDLRTTEERVRMLGGGTAQASPLIELRAPVEGTIIEQNVTPAAGVKSPDNAPNLFTIADLSRVWVLCDVYENDLSRARVGQLARVRLKAYPDRSFAGRIGNISQVLDSNTRTAKVRVEMSNSGGVFRPGMFAVAELESATPQDHVVLPTTAIVQLHDAAWVFLKVGPTTFRRVQVRSGREIEPGVQEILEGLSAGQTVVRNALEFMQTVGQE
jgi:membrane fusion protein, heavy metal efflux system